MVKSRCSRCDDYGMVYIGGMTGCNGWDHCSCSDDKSKIIPSEFHIPHDIIELDNSNYSLCCGELPKIYKIIWHDTNFSDGFTELKAICPKCRSVAIVVIGFGDQNLMHVWKNLINRIRM